MKDLQNAFDQETRNLFKIERLGTELLNRRLKAIGVEVDESQLIDIKNQFANLDGDSFHFEFTDRQVSDAGFESEEQLQNSLSNILDGLSADLEQFSKDLISDIPSIVEKTTDEISKGILMDLKDESKKMLKDQAADIAVFESDLFKQYESAFDLLEMLIIISIEASDSSIGDIELELASPDDYTFEVLRRLHARACQVAYEILILLKSGLADGAYARWRSLHEISVTAYFIKEYGNDIAERYYFFDDIETYKAALIYQENCTALGLEPHSSEELSRLQSRYNVLIERYGNNYGSAYGWASKVTKNKRPTFRDIEKAADLNHLRPHYKWACDNVHANPRGLFYKLGLCPEGPDILLAGPSNIGLSYPGQMAALSFAQVSVVFLTLNPNIDAIVVCKMLMELEREIGEAFVESEKSISASAI